MFPMWIYPAVGAAIALAAFGIGYIIPGAGIPFVALASTMWVAYAASRQRSLDKRR